ncbi:ketoacyl-ACP synthase III family protein [Streptomyces sp. NBC_00435]|uniref:ketoacyl-ACP synthase III family protein n=1 Tax=Streptomyces sp. NBC_00435 TaxID=2903649 RepID=UPI002E1BCDD1
MKWEDVYLSGVGAYVPTAVGVAERIAAGGLSEHAARGIDMPSVAVETELVPPEMASRAAVQALAHADRTSAGLGLIVYASAAEQLHITPAAYVQRVLGADHARAIEVRQASNGMMAGLVVAAEHLAARRSSAPVLIAAGDSFRAPLWDRWSSVPGMHLGDAGAAWLVSPDRGYFKVLATADHADSTLEEVTRNPEPSPSSGFDGLGGNRTLAQKIGLDVFVERLGAGTRSAVAAALECAELDLPRIDHVVVPNLGRRNLDTWILRPLDLALDRTTWSFGRRVGHTGPCDQALGLRHLLDSGALEPGHHVLVIGVGAGFAWTCAVLRVEAAPPAIRGRGGQG